MKTTVQTKSPGELVAQARALIDQGWARGFDELLTDALRRYRESHSMELSESFIREDAAGNRASISIISFCRESKTLDLCASD